MESGVAAEVRVVSKEKAGIESKGELMSYKARRNESKERMKAKCESF